MLEKVLLVYFLLFFICGIVFQPEAKLIDQAVSSVLNSANKPEEVVLSVSKSDILLMNSGSREVSVAVIDVVDAVVVVVVDVAAVADDCSVSYC